jgi:hypothetical protein
MVEEFRGGETEMEQLKLDQNPAREGQGKRMEYLDRIGVGCCYGHFGSCAGYERCEIAEGEG